MTLVISYITGIYGFSWVGVMWKITLNIMFAGYFVKQPNPNLKYASLNMYFENKEQSSNFCAAFAVDYFSFYSIRPGPSAHLH